MMGMRLIYWLRWEHRTIWTWTFVTHERWMIFKAFLSFHSHSRFPWRFSPWASSLESKATGGGCQKITPINTKEIKNPVRWESEVEGTILKRADGPYSSCSNEGLPVSVWTSNPRQMIDFPRISARIQDMPCVDKSDSLPVYNTKTKAQ